MSSPFFGAWPARPARAGLWAALSGWASLAGLLALTSCAVGSPVPDPQAVAQRHGSDTSVVVALTRVEVPHRDRLPFDFHTSRVLGQIQAQPGLLGWGARREVFGTHGWTITVWRDDAARAAFVRSEVHRQAMRRGEPESAISEFKRLSLKPSELPRSWDEVMALWDKPGPTRQSWE